MAKTTKIIVSTRSVTQRIGRKLPSHQQLRSAARSTRWQEQVGLYYIVDTTKGTVIERNVDLAQLAGKLGCLATWEKVDDRWRKTHRRGAGKTTHATA
jgi:hypothetical protein